jgi:uncharacterized protein YecE (DUF72 family)
VRVRIGTSGFSYKEWKGNFYPEKLKQAQMLRFYAERFDAVEINNTFYRMPAASLLERWKSEVGDGFGFVLKAPRRITHEKRLQAQSAEDVAQLWTIAATLGERLGPILFQTPPFLKKDAARLREFLEALPAGCRAAFEFRNASWADEEVYALLRERGAVLCTADMDAAERKAPIVPTARWGYLRLRRADYDNASLGEWAERVLAQPWDEAWVFFKHEDEGKGPALAAAFKKILDNRGAQGMPATVESFRCMMCGHQYQEKVERREDKERSCPKCRSCSIRQLKKRDEAVAKEPSD